MTVCRGRREGGEPRSVEPSTGEPVTSSTTGRVEDDSPDETSVTAETTPKVRKLMSSGSRLRSRVPKHMRSILRDGKYDYSVSNKLHNVYNYACSVHYSVGGSKALPGGTCILYMYMYTCWPGLDL